VSDGTRSELREPHFMQDRDYLRDLRDLENERRAIEVEDATASPTYAPSGDSDTTGGME
jgi:hypothetical protein